jgi:hypothetical protein
MVAQRSFARSDHFNSIRGVFKARKRSSTWCRCRTNDLFGIKCSVSQIHSGLIQIRNVETNLNNLSLLFERQRGISSLSSWNLLILIACVSSIVLLLHDVVMIY